MEKELRKGKFLGKTSWLWRFRYYYLFREVLTICAEDIIWPCISESFFTLLAVCYRRIHVELVYQYSPSWKWRFLSNVSNGVHIKEVDKSLPIFKSFSPCHFFLTAISRLLCIVSWFFLYHDFSAWKLLYECSKLLSAICLSNLLFELHSIMVSDLTSESHYNS